MNAIRKDDGDFFAPEHRQKQDRGQARRLALPDARVRPALPRKIPRKANARTPRSAFGLQATNRLRVHAPRAPTPMESR
ncbi:MAG: hypothetical protein F4204_03580 [Rhodospirillaceae bacterium]|nr:hypothetical protein [Rhodospirillaceae bacterium]